VAAWIGPTALCGNVMVAVWAVATVNAIAPVLPAHRVRGWWDGWLTGRSPRRRHCFWPSSKVPSNP
jgi:hypothetical protein